MLQTLDATTGQNALNQVEIFRNVAGVNGLVMTKLDGTARGGILVAIAAKYKLPVYFIGVGEGVDDLEPFAAQDFAAAIAGVRPAMVKACNQVRRKPWIDQPIFERDPSSQGAAEHEPARSSWRWSSGPLMVFFFANARGEWLAATLPGPRRDSAARSSSPPACSWPPRRSRWPSPGC